MLFFRAMLFYKCLISSLTAPGSGKETLIIHMMQRQHCSSGSHRWMGEYAQRHSVLPVEPCSPMHQHAWSRKSVPTGMEKRSVRERGSEVDQGEVCECVCVCVCTRAVTLYFWTLQTRDVRTFCLCYVTILIATSGLLQPTQSTLSAPLLPDLDPIPAVMEMRSLARLGLTQLRRPSPPPPSCSEVRRGRKLGD